MGVDTEEGDQADDEGMARYGADGDPSFAELGSPILGVGRVGASCVLIEYDEGDPPRGQEVYLERGPQDVGQDVESPSTIDGRSVLMADVGEVDDCQEDGRRLLVCWRWVRPGASTEATSKGGLARAGDCAGGGAAETGGGGALGEGLELSVGEARCESEATWCDGCGSWAERGWGGQPRRRHPAFESWWRRSFGSHVRALSGPASVEGGEQGLRAAQIGVAVKGGADLGVHIMQAALDRHLEWHVILDVATARPMADSHSGAAMMAPGATAGNAEASRVATYGNVRPRQLVSFGVEAYGGLGPVEFLQKTQRRFGGRCYGEGDAAEEEEVQEDEDEDRGLIGLHKDLVVGRGPGAWEWVGVPDPTRS
eukprot:gene34123-biopygen14349